MDTLIVLQVSSDPRAGDVDIVVALGEDAQKNELIRRDAERPKNFSLVAVLKDPAFCCRAIRRRLWETSWRDTDIVFEMAVANGPPERLKALPDSISDTDRNAHVVFGPTM